MVNKNTSKVSNQHSFKKQSKKAIKKDSEIWFKSSQLAHMLRVTEKNWQFKAA